VSYYFTGLAAEMIQQLDPALVALLREKSRTKRIELGHHGANRPPRPMPIERVKGQNWQDDVKAITEYESCSLDPNTGQLNCARPGGLKNMTETIFQQRLLSTGRFFQASILYAEKHFGIKMAVGLQDNTGAPRGDAWFLGILNRPDGIAIGPEILLRWALGGPSPLPGLEQRLAQLDRARIRLLSLLVHDHDFYRGSTATQTEQIWAKYEEIIQWAHDQHFEILSLSDLYDLVVDDRERTVTKSELQKIAEVYVKQIESAASHYPPDYIDVGNDYFSLADAWQALAQALAQYQQTGALPAQVTTRDMIGPTTLSERETRPQIISPEDIVISAANALSQLSDRIPTLVKLGRAGIEVNASEHLYLMAKEFSHLLAGSPQSVEVLSIRLVSKNIEAIQTNPSDSREGRADPLTKQQFWTFKPARWK
jgi:hypothetical protein